MGRAKNESEWGIVRIQYGGKVARNAQHLSVSGCDMVGTSRERVAVRRERVAVREAGHSLNVRNRRNSTKAARHVS
jgi:hypothetical protein